MYRILVVLQFRTILMIRTFKKARMVHDQAKYIELELMNIILLFIQAVSFKVLTELPKLHFFVYKFEFCDVTILVEAICFLYRKQLSFEIEPVVKLAV
jgi:hypothetical protein